MPIGAHAKSNNIECFGEHVQALKDNHSGLDTGVVTVSDTIEAALQAYKTTAQGLVRMEVRCHRVTTELDWLT